MPLNSVEQPLDDGTVIRGWASGQRGLPLLLFLHGNGFAAGIYLPMLRHLVHRFDLLALDIPGHGRSDNVQPFGGWNDTAERLHTAALATGYCQHRPVYGVGHSLGGAMTLLSAYRHPQTYSALVLLDPILFPRSMIVLMRIVSALRLTGYFHPHFSATLRRRNQWSDRDDVIAYLRRKTVFKNWAEESLLSFASHAIRDAENGVVLACEPATEAGFFASLPTGLWRSINGVRCPTTMIMGQSTYPFALRAAMAAEKANKIIRQKVISGSHCFMQEQPENAALEVIRALEARPPGIDRVW